MELLLCFVIVLSIVTFILSVKDFSYHKAFRQDKSKSVIVIPISDDENNIEIYIRYIVKSIKNSGINLRKVILFDTGMNDEQLQICNKLCEENSMIEIANRKEIVNCLTALLK